MDKTRQDLVGEQTDNAFSKVVATHNVAVSKIEEFKKSKITTTPRNIIFVVSVIAALAFIVLFGLQILTATFALFLSLVLIVVAVFGIRFLKQADPLIKQKTKNYVLKKMIEEAKKNAITHLENEVMRKFENIQVLEDKYVNIDALVKKMKSKISNSNSEKNIAAKEKMIKTHEDNLEHLYSHIKQMKKHAKDFESKVDDYKDMQEFIEIGKEAAQFFSDAKIEKLHERLNLAAFEQIDKEFYKEQAKAEYNSKSLAGVEE